MTLCIAVKCNELDGGAFDQFGPERVVCCFDAQVGNEYESSESEYKLRPLTPTAVAMYSGPSVLAKDLITEYGRKLSKAKLKVGNYRDVLWGPMKAFSEANTKKDYLIGDSEVSLLIAALVETKFRIVTINSHGIIDHPYFGAIGTGEDSATAILRWRKPTSITDLQAAQYFAYEAKKLGEVSPYVGKVHTTGAGSSDRDDAEIQRSGGEANSRAAGPLRLTFWGLFEAVSVKVSVPATARDGVPFY